jgi:hypothetical protein
MGTLVINPMIEDVFVFISIYLYREQLGHRWSQLLLQMTLGRWKLK